MKNIRLNISLSLTLVLVLLYGSNLKAQTITNNGDTIYISNGTTLYINGSLQNLDNGTNYPYIGNNGALQISGDFTKSANTIYTGQDSLLISGSGAQNIAGLNYWYMAITSGGTKTLTDNMGISRKLVLTNGSLNTGIYTATLDSQATLVEDSLNFVTGNVKMQKYLGKGTNYTFGGIGLEIKSDSLAPGMTTVTRVTGSHLNGNGYQGLNRYFTIVPTNNGKTASTFKFHYFDGELNSISEGDLAIYRYKTNGKWEYDGYTSRNSGSNVITASLDTLGTITAASILNPLPVELMSFHAILFTPQTARLNWVTASELNNDHFDIERSENGIDFTWIGEVKGHGTTNTIINYQYDDKFGIVNTQVLYYRIKQVDFNGAYVYSEIRRLELSEQVKEFKAWYNSSTDKTEVLVYNPNETHASLRMIDIQGKLITWQQLLLPQGQSHLELDMFGLAKAVYILSMSDKNGIEVTRIMKQ